MNYILIIYGLVLGSLGINRLKKMSSNNNDRKSGTPNLEAKYKDSWNKIIIFSAFFSEFINLSFLIPAAYVVNNRAIKMLAFIISILLVFRAFIITVNVMRCPTLKYYEKVETTFYSTKGKKYSHMFDWMCVVSLGIIIGALF